MNQQPHNSPETYDNVRNFLKENYVGTLATVTKEGKPHAVVLYYTVNSDLTLSFLTKKNTLKSQNIEHDNSVMFVVFEPQSQTVVQIEGKALEITDEPEAGPVFEKVLKIVQDTSDSGVPPISKIFEAGHYVAYKIIPTQIRMAVFARPDPGTYDQFEVLNF